MYFSQHSDYCIILLQVLRSAPQTCIVCIVVILYFTYFIYCYEPTVKFTILYRVLLFYVPDYIGSVNGYHISYVGKSFHFIGCMRSITKWCDFNTLESFHFHLRRQFFIIVSVFFHNANGLSPINMDG